MAFTGLAVKPTAAQLVERAASAAYAHLHARGRYAPEDLASEKPYRDLISATRQAINPAIEDAGLPGAMAAYLKRDNHVFSGLKTNAQLREAARLLTDESGRKRPYASFEKEALKLNESYNKTYLEAEYLFATQSAQMAAKWVEFENGAGRYDLQYRTASDDKVRASHRQLHDVTLPSDDPFWSSYYPPNGWRCRCTVVEVRKGKYPVTDSATARAAGESATTQIGADGKNSLQIFRFNPGKDKVLFPPEHPYTKVAGADAAVNAVRASSAGDWVIEKEINSTADLREVLASYAKAYPETFKNGFLEIEEERSSSNNGSTNRRGTIWLNRERLSLVKSGFNSIRKGVATTYEQEDAISTLWHEMIHCHAAAPQERLTATQRLNMEMANEYVSRKTLGKFMERLGGELQNKVLESDRPSTGYNRMVMNFQHLVDWSGADHEAVLQTVSKHLFEESYTNQIAGLVDAVRVHSPYKLKAPRELVVKARDLSTGYYLAQLEEQKPLLVKKKR